MGIRKYRKRLDRSCPSLIVVGSRCVYHGDIFPDPESPIGRDLPAKIQILCSARKQYAYGVLKDYFVEKNLIGFVRLGEDKHPNGCAVVMCNLPERSVSVMHGYSAPWS